MPPQKNKPRHVTETKSGCICIVPVNMTSCAKNWNSNLYNKIFTAVLIFHDNLQKFWNLSKIAFSGLFMSQNLAIAALSMHLKFFP